MSFFEIVIITLLMIIDFIVCSIVISLALMVFILLIWFIYKTLKALFYPYLAKLYYAWQDWIDKRMDI